MRYLYTGWLPAYGTCEARRRGLLEMGRDVISLSYAPFFQRLGPKFEALQMLLGFGPGILGYNRHLLAAVRVHRPDIVWIDKGHYVARSTLRAIKEATGAFLVCYNTDDIAYQANGWRLHIPAIPEYDLYFTTNRFNVEEIRALGARRVIPTHLGYDRDLFKPYPTTQEDARRLGALVGFIGHWEPATEALIRDVVDLGLPLRVWGLGWDKAKHRPRLAGVVLPIIVRGVDYVKAIMTTKINLGINSAQSRNLSSGRSFEIPAAGGFLLAQRTEEHQASYEEGVEAEFFESAAKTFGVLPQVRGARRRVLAASEAEVASEMISGAYRAEPRSVRYRKAVIVPVPPPDARS